MDNFKYYSRDYKDFILYHVWNRSELNEIWFYDKLEKLFYLCKYANKSDFDLLDFLFNNKITSRINGRRKQFNKIHEDDFYSKINNKNYKIIH